MATMQTAETALCKNGGDLLNEDAGATLAQCNDEKVAKTLSFSSISRTSLRNPTSSVEAKII